MELLYPDIYHSANDHPFGDEVCTRAYLVTRSEGNLLFYSSASIEESFEFIHNQGGLSAQYLNHRDEASAHCDRVRERFGAPLSCHQLEAFAVSQQCQVTHTFEERQLLKSNLEVIPTPGHCPGSSCYLLTLNDRRYLFCGDTLYPDQGQWTVFVDDSRDGDKSEMISSLELLREVPVDVVLPGLFVGNTAFEAVSKERWSSIIDQCLRQLG
ncbi:MAG: MBL fold metallo-hydrolase [Motiliproteus sp.]|nr:MBL fold metallo-hydrolase [Motiliproteus sp.]